MADVQILEGYLTQPELAKQLGKSTRTLERWDSQRTGPPPTIIGRRKLYHVDDVRTWLKGQRRELKPIRTKRARGKQK